MISEFKTEAPELMVIKESECFEPSNLDETMIFSTTYSISHVLEETATRGKCGLVEKGDNIL